MSEIKSNPAVAPQKFEVPADWRARCDVIRLNSINKPDFFPLHPDFLRALAGVQSIDFIIYFAAGWDLFDLVRPKDFSPELVKEAITLHKQFPSATRICVRKVDYGRYERIISEYRRKKFEDAATGMPMLFEPAFKIYAELSNASQLVVRGMIDKECYMRIARAGSSAVLNMCTTRDALRFLVEIVGKEPSLYDHGAVTALIASALCWNTLKLPKRESKVTTQSALLHDAERHCAYIGRPADPKQISVNAIKEIATLANAHEAFHESNLIAMQQYRERYNGSGYPRGLRGSAEDNPSQGINRMARIVAIGCAFSEYLLKRRDKKPLDLDSIAQFLKERARNGEFDPEFVDQLFDGSQDTAIRRPGDDVLKDGDDDDDYDV